MAKHKGLHPNAIFRRSARARPTNPEPAGPLDPRQAGAGKRSAGPSQSSYRGLIFDRGFLRKTAAVAPFWARIRMGLVEYQEASQSLRCIQFAKIHLSIGHSRFTTQECNLSSSLPEITAKSACAVVLNGPDARRRGLSARTPERRPAGGTRSRPRDREACRPRRRPRRSSSRRPGFSARPDRCGA